VSSSGPDGSRGLTGDRSVPVPKSSNSTGPLRAAGSELMANREHPPERAEDGPLAPASLVAAARHSAHALDEATDNCEEQVNSRRTLQSPLHTSKVPGLEGRGRERRHGPISLPHGPTEVVISSRRGFIPVGPPVGLPLARREEITPPAGVPASMADAA